MRTLNDLSDRALAFFALLRTASLQRGRRSPPLLPKTTSITGSIPMPWLNLFDWDWPRKAVGKINFTLSGQVLLARFMDLLRGAR
jgi:hypothetical protein